MSGRAGATHEWLRRPGKDASTGRAGKAGELSVQLHQRGVDLLVNLQDAADHVDRLTRDDIQSLLKEASACSANCWTATSPSSVLFST